MLVVYCLIFWPYFSKVMTKKTQNINLKIFGTKSAFKIKQKAFFIIFKELLVAGICSIPESATLIDKWQRQLSEKKYFVPEKIKLIFVTSI